MRDISEQLSNSIKWEKKGETIIPKAIDVVKLSRMKFKTGFSISISKRYTLNAPFHRTFELYTKDIEILAGPLEPLQLLKKLNQTSSKIAELEKNFNEKLKFSLEAEEKKIMEKIDVKGNSDLQTEIKKRLKRCKICVYWKGYYSENWSGPENEPCSKYQETPQEIPFTNPLRMYKDEYIELKWGISCE